MKVVVVVVVVVMIIVAQVGAGRAEGGLGRIRKLYMFVATFAHLKQKMANV